MSVRATRAAGVIASAGALAAIGCAAATPSLASADPARSARPVTAYIVDAADDTVVPLNVATNTLGRPMKVGLGPDAIVFSPVSNMAYVADGNLDTRRAGNTVAVIDTKTNTVGRFVKVPPRPEALVITPDGKTVYVLTPAGLTPISTATKKAGRTIALGAASPSAMVISADGTTIYVGAYNTNTVIPVSTATNTAGKPIKVGSGPFKLAMAPGGRTLYVLSARFGRPDRNLGSVTAIRTATNTAGKPVQVGKSPSGIAFAPGGKTAWIATDEPVVTVRRLDIATGRLGRPIKVSPPERGAGPGSLVVTPNGKTVYVTSWAAGTVTPVNTATGTVGRAIHVPAGPTAITVSPSGATVYAFGSGPVVAIRASTNTISKVLSIGGLVAFKP
jgi:YVTN family beta-propeller protein